MNKFGLSNFILIVFGLFTIFCAQSKMNPEPSLVNQKNSNQISFELTDSIEFKNYNFKILLIVDKLGSKYLGYDVAADRLIEFDLSGKILNRIDFRIDDAFNILLPKFGFKYLDENQIIIAERGGVSILDTKLKKRRFLNNNSLFGRSIEHRIGLVKNKDDTILFMGVIPATDMNEIVVNEEEMNNMNNDSRYPDRGEQFRNNMTSFKIGDSLYHSIAPFPTNSVYKSKDIFFPYNSIKSFVCELKYYIVNEYEPVVWVYNIDGANLKLVDFISIFPREIYSIRGLPYGKPYNRLEYEKMNMSNISFSKLFVADDTILVSYTHGLESEIIERSKSTAELYQSFSEKFQEYIILMIKGNKVGIEFPLPRFARNVLYIHSLNEILVSKNSYKMGEDHIDKIYIFKLHSIK